MAGSIFTTMLRHHWRQIMWWGIGLGVLSLYIFIVIPDASILEDYMEFVQVIPEAMLKLIGFENVEAMTTPVGFVASFQTFMLLFMMGWAVMAGMSVTANEEDDGVMDLVLSLPVPRWRVVLERFLFLVLVCIVILLVTFLGFYVGHQFSTMDIDMGASFVVIVAKAPVVLFAAALTVLMTVLIRRKDAALGAAAGIIVGSYFLDFLAEAASGTIFGALHPLSMFYYYNGSAIIADGINWLHLLVPAIGAVVLLAASLWAFERRDVGL